MTTKIFVSGGCLLALMILFLPAAASLTDDAEAVILSMITVLVFLIVAAWLWKLPWRVILLISLCTAIGHLGYYRYGTAQGILAGYGVHYDNDPDAPPFASSALNRVRLWFNGPQGRLPGPTLFGDMIYIEKPYRKADGHVEFVVRSSVWKESATRIQLLSPPEGKMAFRVMEDARLHVTYSLQPDLPFD